VTQDIHRQFRDAVIRREAAKELALLENDLGAFFRAAWPVLEPTRSLVWSWHYDLLVEFLEAITSGQFKERYPEKAGIVICVPPRSSKSGLVTITWPVWTWLKRPSMRFLCASYSGTLSSDHSKKRRDLIMSRWFQECFGTRFALSDDLNRIDDFGNDKTGRITATSVGGTTTGRGADFCIADDLISQDESFSEAACTAATRWVDSTWSTKLDDPRTGVFVHVSQRLAENDVPGHLLEHQPDRWIHLKVPLEAEQEECYVFPLSGRVHHRPRGDILLPERYSLSEIQGYKSHALVWSGQYQQQPCPTSGVIFNPSWWRYYKSSDGLPSFDRVVISVDCAFKAADENDFVGIQKWGAIGPRSYLLESRTEHLGYTATKAAIKAMNNHGLQAGTILIEDKANGSAVIEELQREDLGPNVIAISPEGGKESRAYAASADCEAGNVYLPEDAPWLSEFLRVSAQFPRVRHDDSVDAMTQFLNWRRKRILRYGFSEFCERITKAGGVDAYFAQRERERSDREVTAINPKTGQRLRLDRANHRWLPI